MKVLRVKKYLKYVILSAVLIYLLFLIVPYVSHKAVSEELKQSFRLRPVTERRQERSGLPMWQTMRKH